VSAALEPFVEAAAVLIRDRGYSPLETTAALARALDSEGLLDSHPLFETVDRLPPESSLPLLPDDCAPDSLGQVYEQLLDGERRRETGSHYTPPQLASGLVELALTDWDIPGPITVCDPAVGSGAFLLAAARALEQRGLERSEIVSSRLFGSDLSDDALVVADAALTLWAGAAGPGSHLVQGDAVSRPMWTDRFTLVVGNPPFLSQLATATVRSRGEAAALKGRFGDAALGYVDSAALFLLAALDLVAARGRLLMIQPQSTLAASDAAAVRSEVENRGELTDVWIGGRQSFAAEVEVCALLIEVGAMRSRPIRVHAGDDLESRGSHDRDEVAAATTWSPLLASASGVPRVDLARAGTLGDLCTATAGFRDQFYGLAAHTRESDISAGGDRARPLLTVGMIDPARARWGTASFRFNRRRWVEPVLDLESLASADRPLADWVDARLVPKVCVATQTKVVEALVDVEGSWVPATPVISVEADPADLWLVGAALMAPPVSAWAMQNHAGAALSAAALRLSAKQILGVPVPADPEAWEAGAMCLQMASAAAEAADREGWRSGIEELGSHMCTAYGVADQAIYDWWAERLPPWR